MADGCLFCDLSQSRILCRNSDFYARHDNVPANPGHVEVVPFDHVESFFDLSAGQVLAAWTLMLEARRRIVAVSSPDGWNIGVNDGRAAGRSVDHLHIHLIPRYWGDQPDPRGGIRRGLPDGDPDVWAAQLAALERTDHA